MFRSNMTYLTPGRDTGRMLAAQSKSEFICGNTQEESQERLDMYDSADRLPEIRIVLLLLNYRVS